MAGGPGGKSTDTPVNGITYVCARTDTRTHVHTLTIKRPNLVKGYLIKFIKIF